MNKSKIIYTLLLMCSLFSFPAFAQTGNITKSSPGSFQGQENMTINNLACGLPVFAPLGINRIGYFTSNDFHLKLGVDTNFGGIGTDISLINPDNQTEINVVENRSGAGAAWQSSYMIQDIGQDQLIVFNQGAGNSAAMQWGYSNAVKDLTQTGWMPMYADHANLNFSIDGVSGRNALFTPCKKTGYQFDEGRSSIVTNSIETPYGDVFHIVNTFQTHSLMNQWWKLRNFEQALYLNAQIAHDHNLRVYFHGKSGWNIGPFNIFNPFNTIHGSSICNGYRCSGNIDNDLDYAYLVWDVGGKDIALVLRAKKNFGISWASEKGNPYCNNPDDFSCGSIDFHIWMREESNVSIKKDEITTSYGEYYVARPIQLKAIGIDPTTSSTIPDYGREVQNCKKNKIAESNNQLPNLPVSNLIDMKDFYSSNIFPDANANGTVYASTITDNGFGYIRLTPRISSGKVYGFPSVYSVILRTTDNSKLSFIGTYNQQPDATGVVDIPLGYKLNTSSPVVSAITLGFDNYGNYYYQLVGMQGCD